MFFSHFGISLLWQQEHPQRQLPLAEQQPQVELPPGHLHCLLSVEEPSQDLAELLESWANIWNWEYSIIFFTFHFTHINAELTFALKQRKHTIIL